MVTCLLAVLKKAAQKVVNFDKLREIQQEKEENPASFFSPNSQGHYDTTQKLTLRPRTGQ
jgi:hypothetical protein